jgi:hypothetical protein
VCCTSQLSQLPAGGRSCKPQVLCILRFLCFLGTRCCSSSVLHLTASHNCLQVGVPASRKCSHCHRTMACSIPSASFLPRGPPKAGSAAAAGAGRGPRVRRAGGVKGGAGSAVLQEGSPLPLNGACKHYRHSYRCAGCCKGRGWWRFCRYLNGVTCMLHHTNACRHR